MTRRHLPPWATLARLPPCDAPEVVLHDDDHVARVLDRLGLVIATDASRRAAGAIARLHAPTGLIAALRLFKTDPWSALAYFRTHTPRAPPAD